MGALCFLLCFIALLPFYCFTVRKSYELLQTDCVAFLVPFFSLE